MNEREITAAALQILKVARQAIKDESNWGKGSLKRYNSDTASYQYCLLGALCQSAAYFSGVGDCARDALYDLMPTTFRSLAVFNDKSTHQEVLALFDQAIAKVTKQV